MDWLSLGQHIREKRLAKSWKQSILAEKADLSVAYIGMLERGEKLPGLIAFVDITNALDTTADELLEGGLNQRYAIRMSEYTKRIQRLPKEEQDRIFAVLDTMLKYSRK